VRLSFANSSPEKVVWKKILAGNVKEIRVKFKKSDLSGSKIFTDFKCVQYIK